jgi:hypothetical protein
MAKNEDSAVGYEWEDEVKLAFAKLQAKFKFTSHKYVDTKAAARFVGPQPADFQIAYINAQGSNEVMLIECKASVLKQSLRECASGHISPQQIGKFKLWHRAGGRGMFWFYCQSTGDTEFWPSDYVVACRSAGKPLDKSHRLAVGDFNDLISDIIALLGL